MKFTLLINYNIQNRMPKRNKTKQGTCTTKISTIEKLQRTQTRQEFPQMHIRRLVFGKRM